MELSRTRGSFQPRIGPRVVTQKMKPESTSPSLEALMQAAQGQFASFLESIPIEPPRIPVVIDTTGTPADSPGAIRTCLIEQLTAPVLWTDAMQWLIEHGMTTFVEVGPGHLLTCLIRAVSRSKTVSTFQTSTAESLTQMLHALGACSRPS